MLTVYRSALAVDQEDADSEAAQVVARFNGGDREHPGLVAQLSSLPRPLPKLTGVFVAAPQGTVTGNFATVKDDEQRLVSADRQWAVGDTIWADGSLTELTLETPAGNPAGVRYDHDSKVLRIKLRQGERCLVPQKGAVTAGTTITAESCAPGNAAQRWVVPQGESVTDGTIRADSQRSLCLTHNSDYPPLWATTMPGPTLVLQTCNPTSSAMQWFASGARPTGAFTAADLATSRSLGSPLGDNPDRGNAAWGTGWDLPNAAQVQRIRESVATASGRTLTDIAAAYSGPVGDPLLRTLPTNPYYPDPGGLTGPISWTHAHECANTPRVAAMPWTTGRTGGCAASRYRPPQLSSILTRDVDPCEFVYVKNPRRNPKDRIGGDC